MLSVVSVDAGTSGVRGLLLDGARVVDRESRAYPLQQPRPGWAEQDPERLFGATLEVVAALLGRAARAPDALVLSAPMHGLMAVDAVGRPLTPFIGWADARAAEVARGLRATPRAAAFCERSGTPLHASLPALKLAWFREHAPEVWRSAARWCGIKSYTLFRLTGRWWVDESVAAATGLYDLDRRAWAEGALRWSGVEAAQLPEVVPTTAVVATLPAGTLGGQLRPLRVVVGSSDGVLASLGCGALRPGVWAVSAGTSGAVRCTVDGPARDPDGRLFCYPLADGLHVAGGPVNNGGVVYRWLRDLLADDGDDDDGYQRLDALAAQVAPGAEGLFFLPYLTGERAPLWDEEVCGVLAGLTLRHGRGHLLRAAMEGVCYELRSVGERLAALAGRPEELRATGGLSRSALWRGILADVTGTGVRAGGADGTAYGGAMLAWRALGEIGRLEDAEGYVPLAEERRPSEEGRAFYDEGYRLFRALLRANRPLMHRMRRLGEGAGG